MYDLRDTICAQSTPSGRGGIHIIRVSGPEALVYSRQIISTKVQEIQPNYVYYGHISEPSTGNKVDEVLFTYFIKGRSFTNEDTVEISCHGNPVIVRSIINLLMQQGCRLAERGEFTYRAYKNGRIDLNQAEAVLSLIESNTPGLIDQSLRLLSGDLSKSLNELETELIWLISRLEAMIDFSTEDIEIEKRDVLIQKLNFCIQKIQPLVKNFSIRQVLDRGIKTLVIGPPNVGKSSLLNFFLDKKRAIVSDQPGTTRDFLAESTFINNKLFEIIDTAGLRESEDFIEKEGIEMAQELIDKADIVICLLDPENLSAFSNYLDLVEKKKFVLAINKMDLLSSDEQFNIKSKFMNLKDKISYISIYEKTGLMDLKQKLTASFEVSEKSESLEVISVRQNRVLNEILGELEEAASSLSKGLGEEFVLSHLNTSLKALFNLKFIDDDELVRDQIFKDFCLGK